MASKTATYDASPTVSELADSFKRSLAAQNKSPNTIKAYREATTLLDRFLADQGMPHAVAALTRDHIEAFVSDLLAKWKPTTAHNRYRALQSFFKWCVEEGEIKVSPMVNMHPPHLPEFTPPVIQDEDLKKLLKQCEGNGYEERRDTAIIRVFIDTGCRRAEVAGMRVSDIDWTYNVVKVVGKGNRERIVPFNRKCAQALDRYLRLRNRHSMAVGTDALWIGSAGPMTDSGLAQAVERRADDAGIPHVNLHRFRHTFAHRWLSADGGETDLMMLTGWRSRTMVSRYGASAASERAREAHQRMGLGDRL